MRFLSGHNRLGMKVTAETRAKLSGESNGQWRGDDVSYHALHMWVYKNKQRLGTCEKCGAQPEPYAGMEVGTDFANVSGEYRRDVDDWIELCRPCHSEFDKARNAKRLTRSNA